MFGKSIILGLAIVVMLAAASCGGGAATFMPDTSGPELTISGISDGQNITKPSAPRVIEITADATDDSNMASISLLLNGVDVSGDDLDASVRGFRYRWVFIAADDYKFEFLAKDTLGNPTRITYTVHVVP